MGAAASTRTILVPKSDDAGDPERYALAEPAELSMPLDVLEQIATVYLHAVPTTANARFWAAVLLSQINRQMRTILLSRGSYWSDIFIDAYGDLRTADIALQRSASAPLHVEISKYAWRSDTPVRPDAERIVRDLLFNANHVGRIEHLVVTWLPAGLEPPRTPLGGTEKIEGPPIVCTPKALRSLVVGNVLSYSLLVDWVGEDTFRICLKPPEVEEGLVQLERMASNAPNLLSLEFGSLYMFQVQLASIPAVKLRHSNSRSRGPLVELLIGEPAVAETAFSTIIELVEQHYPGTLRGAQLIAIDPNESLGSYIAKPRLQYLGIQEITERCTISIEDHMYTVVYRPSGRTRIFWVLENVLHGEEEPWAKEVWRHLVSCAESLHMRNMHRLELAQYLDFIRAVPGICSALRELGLDVLKNVLCNHRCFKDCTSTPRIPLPSLTMLALRPTERDYRYLDVVRVWSVSTDKKLATEKLPIVGKNWAWIIDQFDLPQSERAKVKWANDVQEYDRRVFTDLVDRAWREMTDGEPFFCSI